jgi:hypothetical protein
MSTLRERREHRSCHLLSSEHVLPFVDMCAV